MSNTEKAEHLVSKFLTEVPYREGIPYPNTDDAKINAVIAVGWVKDSFAGEYHKRDCDEIIKEIKLL